MTLSKRLKRLWTYLPLRRFSTSTARSDAGAWYAGRLADSAQLAEVE